MIHLQETSGGNINQNCVPPRPPKPNSFFLEDDQPTYLTTVPGASVASFNQVKQPKGILKNSVNWEGDSKRPLRVTDGRDASKSIPKRISDKVQNRIRNEASHFERSPLEFERNSGEAKPRSHEIIIEEQTQLLSDANNERGRVGFKSKRSKPQFANETNTFGISSNLSKEEKIVRENKNEGQSNNLKNKRDKRKKVFKYNKDTYSKATRAAGIESAAGILHLIVIVTSIITIVMMSKLTNDWELGRRRCPMYVKNTPNVGIYWGNEKLTACHYGAFMPVLILVMSFGLMLFHGGILFSWRNGGDSSKILLTKAYPKIMFAIESTEMVLAISVAGVIADGFRQTCLSFQLNPWPEERPVNCKGGYRERDDVYGISGTYSRLLTSIVSSTISMVMLIIISLLYFFRMKVCRRKKFSVQP